MLFFKFPKQKNDDFFYLILCAYIIHQENEIIFEHITQTFRKKKSARFKIDYYLFILFI
jgi:hypothetical protein